MLTTKTANTRQFKFGLRRKSTVQAEELLCYRLSILKPFFPRSLPGNERVHHVMCKSVIKGNVCCCFFSKGCFNWITPVECSQFRPGKTLDACCSLLNATNFTSGVHVNDDATLARASFSRGLICHATRVAAVFVCLFWFFLLTIRTSHEYWLERTYSGTENHKTLFFFGTSTLGLPVCLIVVKH